MVTLILLCMICLLYLREQRDKEPSFNTIKDIAGYISVHYTTVSRAIKKIEREDEK